MNERVVPDEFWMVMVEGRGGTSKRHATLNDARIEAERLAKLPENIGTKVWILEASSYAEVTLLPVTWTYYK